MINEIIERLQKCPEYSCSRCIQYGTNECAVKEAVVELQRFDRVLDLLKESNNEDNL